MTLLNLDYQTNLTDESIVKTISTYKRSLRSNVRGLWSGVLSIEQFESAIRSTITRGINQAFAEGAKEFGIKPNEFSQEELAFINKTINDEMKFLPGLTFSIIENSKAEGGKLQPLLNRLENWSNRYLDVVNRARTMVGWDLKLMWHLGPTSKHCR